MKEKDLEQIRREVRNVLDEQRDVVVFDCPSCQHQTVAKKEYYIDWSKHPGRHEVYCPPMRDWDDRKCLVCGKLFQYSHSSKYIEVSL